MKKKKLNVAHFLFFKIETSIFYIQLLYYILKNYFLNHIFFKVSLQEPRVFAFYVEIITIFGFFLIYLFINRKSSCTPPN